MFCISISFAQQTPAPKQSKDMAIVGATAHIGDGTIIENSIIVLRNGKIDVIENAETSVIDMKALEVINARGHHVYPGFIAPNSTLGLVEIDAVKASDDDAEIGVWNPHIRSLIAYNAESKIIESMRPNGVLLGQIVPKGGVISGTSSIVQFDAWNWEDAAIKVDDGIHLNWPKNFSKDFSASAFGQNPNLKPNDKYTEQIKKLDDYFIESKTYGYVKNQSTVNLPFQAMQGLFNGSKKLYVNVAGEKGIIDAVHFSKKHGLKNMVIVGGYEAYKVAKFLKENNISVLIQRVHSLPILEDDDYDLPYKLAKLLVDEGVLVSLQVSGDMERMNTRNLPFYAGTTVAYGLTKEQALQLITLNAAKILGIDDSYGSLSKGKNATLFISKGDALDMSTNIITHAFIDGRLISLETHQTELWKRYSEKYKNQ